MCTYEVGEAFSLNLVNTVMECFSFFLHMYAQGTTSLFTRHCFCVYTSCSLSALIISLLLDLVQTITGDFPRSINNDLCCFPG